jgi:hypothetical protein
MCLLFQCYLGWNQKRMGPKQRCAPINVIRGRQTNLIGRTGGPVNMRMSRSVLRPKIPASLAPRLTYQRNSNCDMSTESITQFSSVPLRTVGSLIASSHVATECRIWGFSSFIRYHLPPSFLKVLMQCSSNCSQSVKKSLRLSLSLIFLPWR